MGRIVFRVANAFQEKLVRAGLLFPANFYGLSQTGFLHTQSILDILGRLPDGVSELMCHPGYVDADLLRAGTRLLGQRQVEIEALTAAPVRKLVADHGIRLMDYWQLGRFAYEHVDVIEQDQPGPN